ncbi:MAG: hypothetical protein ACQESA_01370 [Patescibacteria group bacterium]
MLHTSSLRCLECVARQERKDEELFKELSIDEKILFLYRRVKELERRQSQ